MLPNPIRIPLPGLPHPQNELFQQPSLNAAVIVAHPDDETLWCGGLVLQHPDWEWTIVTLCRASDPDRAPRFVSVLDALHAGGTMADLNDGPNQAPLSLDEIKRTIASMLPPDPFDLVITHGPNGEYTRHLRHEECCEAVVELWNDGTLCSSNLWMFAYEDGERSHLPRARSDANLKQSLSDDVWRAKKELLMETYGFREESWETRVCPRVEAFFTFKQPQQAKRYIMKMKATQ